MATDTTDAAPKLVREMGVVDAAMIVVGSMIGSGIFITSAESARLIGSPGWLLAAWALAGLLTVCGALCCSELSAMMPRAGGQYIFLRETYGAPIGFLFGWATFVVVGTGTIAAVAVAFAKFLGVFAPVVAADNYLIEPIRLGGYALSLSTQQLTAIALVIVLTVANSRGLKTGTSIQNVLTFIKTAALIGLIVVGLTMGWRKEAAAFTTSWWDPSANGWSPEAVQPGLAVGGTLALLFVLGRAMVGPLFSQTAWNSVTFTGGEVRDPGRTLPRALILGCLGVVVLYVLANVAYIITLSLPEIQGADQDRVATAMMRKVFGGPGLYIMSGAVLVSTFGCVNGLILSGARVYYAMAQDGLFFRQAATTNRRHVPAFALVAQAIWACLLTLPRTVKDGANGPEYGNVYSQLLEYIVSADLAFYIVMVLAVIVMRSKRPTDERPYRVPLYPLPALLYIGLAGLLLLDLLYLAPGTSGMGFVIALSGLPVYFLWRALSPRREVAG